jgi:hypothetical protein
MDHATTAQRAFYALGIRPCKAAVPALAPQRRYSMWRSRLTERIDYEVCIDVEAVAQAQREQASLLVDADVRVRMVAMRWGVMPVVYVQRTYEAMRVLNGEPPWEYPWQVLLHFTQRNQLSQVPLEQCAHARIEAILVQPAGGVLRGRVRQELALPDISVQVEDDAPVPALSASASPVQVREQLHTCLMAARTIPFGREPLHAAVELDECDSADWVQDTTPVQDIFTPSKTRTAIDPD